MPCDSKVPAVPEVDWKADPEFLPDGFSGDATRAAPLLDQIPPELLANDGRPTPPHVQELFGVGCRHHLRATLGIELLLECSVALREAWPLLLRHRRWKEVANEWRATPIDELVVHELCASEQMVRNLTDLPSVQSRWRLRIEKSFSTQFLVRDNSHFF